MATKPTQEQARLHMQVFEQRRETRMREARQWFFKNYIVNTVDDAMRIAPPGSDSGQCAAQVLSYWEQTCALLNYGLLHEELFFETTGEFFAVWERVKPTIANMRQLMVNPHYLEHLEKAAERFESWNEKRAPGHIAAMRQWMKQLTEQAAKAAL